MTQTRSDTDIVARAEPGANVEDALNVLGLGARMEVESDAERVA